VRLVWELVDSDEDGMTVTGACRRGREQLGINTDTLRHWVKPALVDDGERPGSPTSDRARPAELEREVRELRRANAIPKTALAFFAAELDRPSPR
jgi:transposase